jgi:copper homeostasis protein
MDKTRLQQIVEWAYPMGVTCNRAFDATPDPYQALEDIIACGCERVLTSGQKAAAPQAIDVLARLVRQAGDRISVMPGAGVRASNIAQLIRETGAREYHSSARKLVPNPLTFQTKEILDFGNVYIADEAELKAMLAQMG